VLNYLKLLTLVDENLAAVIDKQKIRRIFNCLDYDFTMFNIDHFVTFIAESRQKPILCVPYAFSPGISGAWVSGKIVDFIFCQSETHPIHQIHIKLHELAHMVLEHPLKPVDMLLSPELLHELRSTGLGHLRTLHAQRSKDQIEQEAEYFVGLIQREVMRVRRLSELTAGGTSIPALQPFVATLPYPHKRK
jgi:hypothetical protein